MPRVAIAAGSRIAADAGAAIAANGGNAVDAAIAASITSMVTDPGIIALGGGSFITVWPADAEAVVLDAYAEMPGRDAAPEDFGQGTDEVFMEYGGGMTTIVGYGSIAVPGAVAGFGEASARYGELAWDELIEPAIRWSEQGFPLSGAAAEYMTYAHDVIFGWHDESYAALHHPDGSHLQEGEVVHIPGLADTLRLLASDGPSVFYTGDLGRRLAEDCATNAGLISTTDLTSYRAEPREPLRIPVGDWELATNPPPAVGGAAVAAVLLLMEDVDSWDAAGVAQAAAALRAVFAYRRGQLELVDDRHAAVAQLLEAASLGDFAALLGSPSTIHVSAVDDAGGACSITTSAGYGSGAMISGSGIWLNNSLGETELHPAGLHGQEPGTRLISNMAPTIVRGPQGSVVVVGSPGADRITSAISLTLFNYLRLGMSLDAAVRHPRVHAETFQGEPTIALEPGIDPAEVRDLRPRPFTTESMYFGGVAAAAWSPQSGFEVAADPRRAGGTAIAG